MFFTAVPLTEVNLPPRYACEQSGLNAMELTIPLTFGFHDVIAYGEAAEKLNTLFRA